MDYRELHPSTKIDKTSRFWCGIEVEGEQQGVTTVFIADKIEDPKELEACVAAITDYGVHIFITETFSHWMWYAQTLFPKITHLDRPLFISVMADKVESLHHLRESINAIKDARFLVRVFSAPWIKHLGINDQISIGMPYEMVTFLKGAGNPSHPEDYVEDFT